MAAKQEDADNRNPEVDAWLDAKAHPLDAELRAVRAIILDADNRVEETIKWQTPTFAYKGNIVSFSPAKKMVSLMFHRGAEIPGHHPHLEGDAKLVRNMRFQDMAEIDAGRDELTAVIQAWCAFKDR